MVNKGKEKHFSITYFFTQFTTLKAIHLLILVGFIVFVNSFVNGFVWDDKPYILNNQAVHTINLFAAFTSSLFNTGGQYRPIPVLYFSFLYSLFNTTPFFYHFLQVCLHITNAICVFLLFKRFFSQKVSFLFALLFLVHPIQVESVAYIGAAGNPLFFFFGIVALLLSLSDRVGYKRLLLICSFLLLSLLSKETGVLFLFSVLLYRLLFIKKERVILLWGILSTTLVYCFIRFVIGGVFFSTLDLVPIGRIYFSQRLLTIPAVLFYYVKTVFFPARLTIDQEWIITSINFSTFYLPLFVDVVVLSVIICIGFYFFFKKRTIWKTYVFFSSLFLAGLLLHSQLFPLDITVADRWFYFPLFGLLGILASICSPFVVKKKVGKLFVIVMVVIVYILSTRTIIRNTNWKDSITLYTHDSKSNDNWNIENNLGFEYKSQEQYRNALVHYKKSVALFPFEANTLNTGLVYWSLGDISTAKKYYLKAYSSEHVPANGHKHNLNTYVNLGDAILITEDPKVAKEFFTKAQTDYSDSSDILVGLAVSDYLTHDDNALQTILAAQRIQDSSITEYVYEKISNKESLTVTASNLGMRIK